MNENDIIEWIINLPKESTEDIDDSSKKLHSVMYVISTEMRKYKVKLEESLKQGGHKR